VGGGELSGADRREERREVPRGRVRHPPNARAGQPQAQGDQPDSL
jgi:hypothetical protein